VAKKNCVSRLATPLPNSASEAYELLRQRVVAPDGSLDHTEGRGVIIRYGLAKWAQLYDSASMAPCPEPRQFPHPRPEKPVPGTELVRLVAGLILSMRKESIHA